MQHFGCIFLSERLSSIEDIDAALSVTAEDYHGVATEYVARLDCKFFQTIAAPQLHTNDSRWQDVIRRLKGTTLVLMPALPSFSDVLRDPKIANVINLAPLRLAAAANGRATWHLLDGVESAKLRQDDLHHIVRLHESRSVLSMSTGHFELPSGAHTTHFFRVAECLADLNTIDRIVYWIARELSLKIDEANSNAVFLLLVDNPSTLILALRAIQLFPETIIKCESLPAYPDTKKATNELKTWLESRLSECSNFFCIVSVSSTGALRTTLTKATQEIDRIVSFSVVYSTNQHEQLDAFCRLSIDGYQHWHNHHECELCNGPKQSALFQIDRSRYFLFERKVEQLRLPPRYFDLQRDFLDTYGQHTGVLKTHIDDPNDANPRHHAFYVDVMTLMSLPNFTDSLVQKIRALEPQPDLVVIPPHPVGKVIGRFLEKTLGLPVRFHKDLRLTSSSIEEQELAEALSNSKSVLIVDDLAFTGGRLHRYNRAIRESGSYFSAAKNITFFPLIVLAEDENKWQKTVRGLTSNHPDETRQVISLHRLQLPKWEKNACPWCAEAKEQDGLPLFSSDDSNEQGVRLLKTHDGLQDDQWLNYREGLTVPGFGRSSPVASSGTRSIHLLFACASAVQQLRTESKPGSNRLDPQGFPISFVMDSAVISDFFNEPLLITALLRSLTQMEVSDSFREHVHDLALRIAEEDASSDEWMLRELLFAERQGLAQRIEDFNQRKNVYDKAGQSAYFDPD